ncbi:O-methyltransferase [Salinisphaera hydrothermalis]|uniref:Putative O-methyltransferase n=1 Tax=Salinisphaera hydrothermalis (strain C41B8) TaxID=1304275 RepID=A0A084IR61_SALHC|nr:class I SAM-dependent methyltransferase [Salinisphaera hydrothermalis]KEZ79195.1 putative O-methyltransferase [Salinisphaera hydrothermalis C41B8]
MAEEAEPAALDARLRAYIDEIGDREPAHLAANRGVTEASGAGHLQVSPRQGQLMALLVALAEARRGIEIGVYAGYSTHWLAEAIGPSGRILACDHDPEITARARADWAAAGLADRIDLRLGDALDTLNREVAAGMAGAYDFALIDADKARLIDYYERCMALVRAGGLIMIDNTLWYARVADPACHDDETEAVRAFNRHVAADERVDISVLPIGDGLTLARKR